MPEKTPRVSFTQVWNLASVIQQRLKDYRSQPKEKLVAQIERLSRKQGDKIWYLFYNGTDAELYAFVVSCIGAPQKEPNGKNTRLPQLRRKGGGTRRRSV